jgi:primosomal replication protein N
VNRVFLSGKVRKAPEVAYTPKGRKIVTFPLWVAEGGFSVEVISGGEALPGEADHAAMGNVLVAGELIRTSRRSRDILRVKASKILWMEE